MASIAQDVYMVKLIRCELFQTANDLVDLKKIIFLQIVVQCKVGLDICGGELNNMRTQLALQFSLRPPEAGFSKWLASFAVGAARLKFTNCAMYTIPLYVIAIIPIDPFLIPGLGRKLYNIYSVKKNYK